MITLAKDAEAIAARRWILRGRLWRSRLFSKWGLIFDRFDAGHRIGRVNALLDVHVPAQRTIRREANQ